MLNSLKENCVRFVWGKFKLDFKDVGSLIKIWKKSQKCSFSIPSK
jgi:hypothetical protein